MSPREFVFQIEEQWASKEPLTQVQTQTMIGKLSRFEDVQRQRILDWLLEHCKFRPKVPDIFDAARELGMLERTVQSSVDRHEWHRTDCRLCGGEGRLQVWQRFWNEGERRASSVTKIYRYGSLEAMEHKPEPGEYSFIFRCSCHAGDAPTLPQGWPRWSGNVHQSHLETPEAAKTEPTRQDFLRVGQVAGTARRQPEPKGGAWLEKQEELEDVL